MSQRPHEAWQAASQFSLNNWLWSSSSSSSDKAVTNTDANTDTAPKFSETHARDGVPSGLPAPPPPYASSSPPHWQQQQQQQKHDDPYLNLCSIGTNAPVNHAVSRPGGNSDLSHDSGQFHFDLRKIRPPSPQSRSTRPQPSTRAAADPAAAGVAAATERNIGSLIGMGVDQISRLEDHLKTARREIATLKHDATQYKKFITESQQKHEQVERALRLELESLHGKRKEYETTVENVRNHNSALTAKLQDVTRQHDVLMKKSIDAERIQIELQNSKVIATSLENKISMLKIAENEKKQITSLLDSTKADHTTLLDRYHDTLNDLQNERNRLAAADEMNRKVLGELGFANERETALHTQMDKLMEENKLLKTAEIAAAKAASTEASTEASTVDHLNLANEKDTAVTAQVQQLTTECEQLKTAATEASKTEKMLNTHVQQLTIECEQLKTVATEASKTEKMLRTQVEQLTTESDQMKTAATEASKTEKMLNTHVQKLTTECEQLKTEATAASERQTRLNAQVEQLTTKCEEVKITRGALIVQVQQLQTECEQLKTTQVAHLGKASDDKLHVGIDTNVKALDEHGDNKKLECLFEQHSLSTRARAAFKKSAVTIKEMASVPPVEWHTSMHMAKRHTRGILGLNTCAAGQAIAQRRVSPVSAKNDDNIYNNNNENSFTNRMNLLASAMQNDLKRSLIYADLKHKQRLGSITGVHIDKNGNPTAFVETACSASAHHDHCGNKEIEEEEIEKEEEES